MRSFGYLIGSLAGGVLHDLYPKKGHFLLSVSLIFSGLGTVLIPYTPTVFLLSIITAIQGVANGMQDAVVNTLIIYAHGSKVGPWIQGLYFCFGFGCLISPLLVRAAIATFSEFKEIELEVENDLFIPKDDQVIGAKYAESFWLFFFLSIYSAIHLHLLESPTQKKQ